MVKPTDSLIREIETYCRQAGIAESTFGRHAINDGKLCSRLRAGKNVTLATAERVRSYIRDNGPEQLLPGEPDRVARSPENEPSDPQEAISAVPDRPFRFYDNRQKYLAFVNTCNEKTKVAERAARELVHLKPSPPALRLSLETLPDRLVEHPASVFVFTNLHYREAPWLMPLDVNKAAALNWKEVELDGTSAFEFGQQLEALDEHLVDAWQATTSQKTGNPLYVRPSVLILYRKDHKFLLDSVIPRRGTTCADYDLVIASQPWRARMDAGFKAKFVLSPLTRALRPGGRLLAVQSAGNDIGLEIVQQVWPGEDPFQVNRHDLLKALKDELGNEARDYNFNSYADAKSIFQYKMHTLPDEIADSIGTSTLFAAWNAAVYVAQIEDQKLEHALHASDYLESTARVLQKHNGLWFNDESFVISRKVS